ncbi:MAG: ATP-grasp fold amidoligase family protein [Bacteroidales bacterium]|nr:ATP-grasp fold amidoligase family protein [Bacteroidales bacterium]
MFTQSVCVSYAPYVDKLAVRDYIQWRGMDNILLKHYGVWSKPEDVEFDKLPDKFVLKSNNGCGHHVICRDKSKLNKSEAIATLHKAIKSGVNNVESHYHNITPRVYAEELIDNGNGELPVDYKFTCIGGEVMDVFVATERATSTKYCTMDKNWQPLPYMKKEYLPKQIPEKPAQLDAMWEVAKQLSRDFGFVRVDLYEYRNQPYISELTFFPWGGFLYGYTDEAIKLYGERWWKWKNKQQ